MQCPRCQHANPPQAKFCLECGTLSRWHAPLIRHVYGLEAEHDL